MIRLVDRWASVVLLSTLGGCYNFGLLRALDERASTVAVAIGYFTGVHRKSAAEAAGGDTLELAIDRAAGSDIHRAQLVVQDQLVGELPEQLDVVYQFGDSEQTPELGANRPHLIVIHTDGRMAVLAGFSRVYPKAPSGYAVPVTLDDVRVPCLRAPIASKPIQFLVPPPRTALRDLNLSQLAIEQLVEERHPAVEIRGNYIYWQEGIAIEDAIALYRDVDARALPELSADSRR